MIVCSCNALSEHDFRRAVAQIRADDPLAVITPGLVLHALGKRTQCQSCLDLLFEVIAEETSHTQSRPMERKR